MRKLISGLASVALIALSAWLLQAVTPKAIATSITPLGAWTSTPTPTSTPSTGCFAAWAQFSGLDVDSIAAVSHYDAWAVGPSGAYRWDGSSWHRVPMPMPADSIDTTGLYDLSVRKSDDVWAAGYNNIIHKSILYHWNGTAWNIVPGAAESITQIGSDEAIALNNSVILHCTAAEGCTPMPQPVAGSSFSAVDSSSRGDVWVAGMGSGVSLIERYNGSIWQQVPSPNIGKLTDIAVIAPNDVWAVGESGAMHWNGTSWSVNNMSSFGPIQAVSGVDSNNVWVTANHLGGILSVLHWDGTQWSVVLDQDVFKDVFAFTANDIWVVGSSNIYRYQTIRQFEDVSIDSAFSYFANDLTCRSIINGYPCGSPGEPCGPSNRPYFRPNNMVTRGQLSKIIALSAKLPTAAKAQTFEDVPLGSTFRPYIEALHSAGAINGYLCGGPGEPCISPSNRPYFRPNNNVTRGQTSKIIALTAGYIDPFSSQSFQDVPTYSTFYLYIENLASRSIINGYPCGSLGETCIGPDNRPYFRPANNVTRGQMSKITEITFFP